MAALLDVHAHVLHEVDDGPRDLAAAVALLEALAEDGVGTVWATPHVQPGSYDTSPERRDAQLAEVRRAAQEAGLTITIEPGGELDLEYAGTWTDAELDRFAIGRAVLIEFPWSHSWPVPLEPTCRLLADRGYLPIVAHPERAYAVQREPRLMAGPVGVGAVGQLTAASVSGRFGKTSQQTSFALIEAGHVHLLASDAHNTNSRGPDFQGAIATLGKRYGEEFVAAFLAAPAEVVAGRRPRLPAPRPRRRLPW
jgi:protein-tyrosine phosphatase